MATVYKRMDRGGKSGRWYAEFTNEFGVRERKCTKTRDKRAAEDIAAAWETEAAKKRAGLLDPKAERIKEQNIRPVLEHVDEYMKGFKAAKKSEIHESKTRSKIDAVLAATNWKILRDVTSESLEKFLVTLAETKVRGKDEGSSARTIASYVQAIRGFIRWCVKTHRIAFDPLQHVRQPNPESDRRLERRMILPDEWKWLIKSLEGVRFGMPASDRQLLYEVAVQTAYRSSELRAILVSNVDIKKRVIFIPADETKNTERADQYVTEGLAAKLAKYVKGRHGTEPLFSLCNPTNMARMIRKDLEAARLKWIESHESDQEKVACLKSDFLATPNHSDLVIDFHSLRHTCGAWLAIEGFIQRRFRLL